jgi:biopolymer transport protein ExbD
MNTLLPARRARPISLTALIDVVFILLMFFMLTSSFSQWVALPLVSQAASTVTAADQTPPQLLVLKNDGSLLLANHLSSSSNGNTGGQHQSADFTDLEQAVNAVDSGRALVVVPESDVLVQRIVTSMTRLSALSLPALTLGQSLSADPAQPRPTSGGSDD